MKFYTLLRLSMIVFLACGLSACGIKGKLKSPSQIEASEAKKAQKKAKAEENGDDTASEFTIPQTDKPETDTPAPPEAK